MSKSIRISLQAHHELQKRAVMEQRTVTALVDRWLGVTQSPEGAVAEKTETSAAAANGAVGQDAGGDLEVRRSVGASSSGARADSSAPVRLGQPASTQDGAVATAESSVELPRPAPSKRSPEPFSPFPGGTYTPAAPRSIALPMKTGADLLREQRSSAPAEERLPESVCGRCGVAWRNHQDGTRKNRAPLTGCTTFQEEPF